MSIANLTIVPSFVVMNMVGNTAVFSSALTASAQTLDRGGLKWQAVYTYTELRGDDRGVMMGLIAELRAQANRLRVSVYDNPKRGLYGGTPLVDGAAQTGSSLSIKGCTINITNWIRKGDYFSVDVNGEHELKMATADVNSDGTGLATLLFEPRLREDPLDDAVIFVEDGVLAKPQGIFMMSEPEQNWSSRPGIPSQRMAVSLKMTEDVFATQ